jgi:hypothetical protein
MKKETWAGIRPEHKKQILGRIKASTHTYGREEQRAELIFRNPDFRRDLRRVQKWVSWVKQGRKSKYRALSLFSELCNHWQIRENWNLSKDTLPQCVKMDIGVIYGSAEKGWWDSDTPYPGVDSEAFIYVRIDPWTKREDLEAAWGRIEDLKKTVFGYSDKDKDSFGNMLCWYDLNKEYGLSLLVIARLWMQEMAPLMLTREASKKGTLPDESFKITVREGIKRIEGYIDRLTPPQRRPRR